MNGSALTVESATTSGATGALPSGVISITTDVSWMYCGWAGAVDLGSSIGTSSRERFVVAMTGHMQFRYQNDRTVDVVAYNSAKNSASCALFAGTCPSQSDGPTLPKATAGRGARACLPSGGASPTNRSEAGYTDHHRHSRR